MYDNLKANFELKACRVLTPALVYVYFSHLGTRVLSKSHLHHMFSHLTYTQFIDGTPVRRLFIPRWLKDPDARTFQCMDFLPPPLTAPADTLNMWKGFAVERLPTPGSVAPFLEHVNIIANHDPDTRHFLLGWLARLFQRPGERVEGDGLLILTGAQGCGKDIFLYFLHALLGRSLCFGTANPRLELFYRFSLAHKHRLLINVNVDTMSGRDLARLKEMATSETVMYTEKRMKPLMLTNRARVIITTTTEHDDRWEGLRVLRCSPEKCGDYKYFRELVAYFDQLANQRAVYDFLMAWQPEVM